MKPRIAVIGDVMLNIDRFGETKRICNEAPVPVLLSSSEASAWPGGAAGVASMCSALGAECLLVGHFGGRHLQSLVSVMRPKKSDHGVVHFGVFCHGETATVKHRYYDTRSGSPILMFRYDEDSLESLSREMIEESVNQITKWNPDAIVFCDHGKGVLSSIHWASLFDSINCHFFIDPHPATPVFSDINACWCGSAGEFPAGLSVKSPGGSVIRKAGERGFSYMPSEGDHFYGEPLSKSVKKTISAGDQFIAALAFYRSSGAGWVKSLAMANCAAGLQCQKDKTVPVELAEIASQDVEHLEGLIQRINKR